MKSRSSGALSHDRVSLLISRAWDYELSETEHAQLRQHLETCEACAASAHKFRQFLEALDRFKDKTAGDR